MILRVSRNTVRRLLFGLLFAGASVLAALCLIPSVQKLDLSSGRACMFKIRERRLTPFSKAFSSTLPVLEIVTAADILPAPDQEPVPAVMRVFDQPGEKRLTDQPRALLPFVSVRYRGASTMTAHLRQHSIRMKILDDQQKPSRFNLCGFPPDDDFALIATFQDRSLIRDRLAYELARPLFPWTPHARFAEVFIRKPYGHLNEQSYMGVYLAVEKISVAPGRISMGDLVITNVSDGLDGGGWMVSRDRAASNQPVFWVGDVSYSIVAPGARVITPEAVEFIRRDFSRFHKLIEDDSQSDDLFRLLDMDSFVNMMLLQEFLKNRDAFYFSAYYYRDAGGRLFAGPPWDYNLSMGNPLSHPGPEGFLIPRRPFAGALLRNPRVFELYRQRWRELRRPGAAFSDERILDLVNALVRELDPAAAARHYARYEELRNPRRTFVFTINYNATSCEQHVRIVRDFLLRRARWLDQALMAAQKPEDLLSHEMDIVEAASHDAGASWWQEEESPPLRGVRR